MLALLGLLALPACGADAPDAALPVEALEASPATEVTRAFDLHTHCGVENAFIDGRWWHVVDPLYGAGGPGSGPPAGWGDPTQSGHLVVEGDHAIFGGPDRRVHLTPAPRNDPGRICR